MQKLRLLVIGGVLLTAAIIFAQTLPSTLPLAAREHQSRAPIEIQGFGWVFNLNGKKYQAKITREEIAASSNWTSSLALPLTLAKAEEIARGELQKLVSDDSSWEVTELNLRRLNEEMGAKWYYLVKLMPKLRDRGVIPDSFYVPITFSGEVGRIQIYGQ